MYQNAVYNVGAIGDTVWIGPKLNRMIGQSGQWEIPQQADSLTNGRARLFSIALAPDTVIAGLGYSAQLGDKSYHAGMGFYTSTDGGSNWTFVDQPLETQDDTLYSYGGQDLKQLPVVVPEQSPSYDVSQSGSTLISANWATGILRSQDFGATWERLILPPSSQDSLDPSLTYDFEFNPNNDVNFRGFGTLIDSQGRVWLGTAGGFNVSDNALTAPRDQIRWQHITAARPRNRTGLLGNWIITIKEAPDGTIWMTNRISDGDRRGVVSLTDINEPYQQHLIGQIINDLAFLNGSVIAAGDNGLFISSDNGQSWNRVSSIQSTDNQLPPTTEFLSADVADGRLWVGTNQGLITTTDLQEWEIYRVNFPLKGGNQHIDKQANTKHYAYPNPFSPRRHSWTRIKFEVKKAGNVRIRLLDFNMQPITTLVDESYSPGVYETPWDGLTPSDRRVSDGPVFYLIETPGHVYKGKIMVVN
jgi:hypothetical protein